MPSGINGGTEPVGEAGSHSVAFCSHHQRPSHGAVTGLTSSALELTAPAGTDGGTAQDGGDGSPSVAFWSHHRFLSHGDPIGSTYLLKAQTMHSGTTGKIRKLMGRLGHCKLLKYLA